MDPTWLAVGAGYLLGSIPFGYLLARFGVGLDIRAAGSGNIGAANVTRVVGAGAGALTLVLDAGKGYAAVWLAGWLSGECINCMVAGGIAAILGHLFPVFLRFRGGKGVATGAGAFTPICWPGVAAALFVWLAAVLIWRYVSLGSILAAAALPPFVYFLYAWPHTQYAPPLVVSLGTTLAAVMIILKHHANIQRLVAGTEPKLTLRRRK